MNDLYEIDYSRSQSAQSSNAVSLALNQIFSIKDIQRKNKQWQKTVFDMMEYFWFRQDFKVKISKRREEHAQWLKRNFPHLSG